MLHINWYSVHILYKMVPEQFIVDWLSCHYHVENQDQEIPGMNVGIHTISTSVNIINMTTHERISTLDQRECQN